jgi:hypothetical protein
MAAGGPVADYTSICPERLLLLDCRQPDCLVRASKRLPSSSIRVGRGVPAMKLDEHELREFEQRVLAWQLPVGSRKGSLSLSALLLQRKRALEDRIA